MYVPALLFAEGIGAIAAVQVQAGASDALASVLVAIASVISILCTVPVGGAIDRLGDRSQGRPAHLGESLGHEHRMG